MKTKFALFLTTFILVGSPRLKAHHSFSAEFDASKRVTLKGVVTKVDWRNPHIYVYLNVKDDSGKVIEWACEGGPPNVLMREGWSRNTVKEGDQVTIDGAVAKDSSNRCNSRFVMLSDGRKVFAGSSEENPAGGGLVAQSAPGGGRGGRGPAAGPLTRGPDRNLGNKRPRPPPSPREPLKCGSATRVPARALRCAYALPP